jgi:hypothetical protein
VKRSTRAVALALFVTRGLACERQLAPVAPARLAELEDAAGC